MHIAKVWHLLGFLSLVFVFLNGVFGLFIFVLFLNLVSGFCVMGFLEKKSGARGSLVQENILSNKYDFGFACLQDLNT